jgi:hypothetical protein
VTPDPCKTPSPEDRPSSKADGSRPPKTAAAFNTITGEDWKRSLASARRRRASASERIQTIRSDADADPLWHELHEAARAFRSLLPLVSLTDFGFPEEVGDILAECPPALRPVSSGVEATAFESTADHSIYKFFMPREDGRIGGTFAFHVGDDTALLANAADGTYRAMLEKFDIILRLDGMPIEIIGVTREEGVLITKQTLGERLSEGADTSRVQPPALIPIPSRLLRAHRDHPRLFFVESKPWLVADLHAKNLVRAADGELRAIDLLAAPIPETLCNAEPLLRDWLRRVALDPAAGLLRETNDDEL